MAENVTRVRYLLNPVYGDDGPRTASNTLYHLDRVTTTIRYSSDARELSRESDVETIAQLTIQQLGQLGEAVNEQLAFLAADALRWARQLEDAGIKPEEM